MIFSDNIEKYYYALCSSIQSLKWAVLVKTPGYCSKPHGTWPHDTIPCIVLSPEALGHMSGPPESPWKIDTNRVIYCWFENFRLNYFWLLRIQTQYLIERKLTLHGPLSSPPEQIFPSLIAPSQRSLHSDWARTGVTTTWSSSGLFTPLCAVFPHPEFSQSTPSNKIKILIIVNIISVLLDEKNLIWCCFLRKLYLLTVWSFILFRKGAWCYSVVKSKWGTYFYQTNIIDSQWIMVVLLVNNEFV